MIRSKRFLAKENAPQPMSRRQADAPLAQFAGGKAKGGRQNGDGPADWSLPGRMTD